MSIVFVSSLLQQITFAFISLWKIRVIYQAHDLSFVGYFFLLSSLFVISQLVYDASRKTLLSSQSNEITSSIPFLSQLLRRNFLLLLLIEIAFSSVLLFTGKSTQVNLLSGLLSIIFIVQLQSVSSIIFANFTRKNGFVAANTIQTVCTLATFPLFYIFASSNSLALLLILNFAPNLLPGIITYFLQQFAHTEVKSDHLDIANENHKKFILIQISENSSNSLNASMIGSRLGSQSVAEYSVYSRFAFLYDFVPMALFAFMIKGRDHISVQSERNIRRLLVINAILVTFACCLTYRPIVEYLSSNKLSPSFITIVPYLATGAIISYTSFIIQSSVTTELLSLRARVSLLLLIFNLSGTWILLPSLGPSVAYLATGITTAIYALVLLRARPGRAQSNEE